MCASCDETVMYYDLTGFNADLVFVVIQLDSVNVRNLLFKGIFETTSLAVTELIIPHFFFNLKECGSLKTRERRLFPRSESCF